jgi:UDP-2,3-diacylglucosamine pyrophosphatase LpxH
MLVILSDLHLNDGTTGNLLPAGTMDLLSERLCDLVWRASWRADGSYQPIDRIDLVLLGDVLEITGSQRWLSTPARPWDDPQSPAFVETLSGVVDEILRKNVDAVRTLRALATEATISLPPATAGGEPVPDAEEIPVAVCTHYMVGDHDWPLHVKGSQHDLLRHKVAHHLGLVTQYNKPFPHEACESEELHEALRRHRILARHGDIFDPLAFADDRDASSLSDAISIELIARFLKNVEVELIADLPPAAAAALREIDQIRPTLLIPAWLESMLERTGTTHSLRNSIKRMWDYTVEQLLHLETVRKHAAASPNDLIDGLAAALKFNRRDTTDWTGRTLAWLASLRGAHGLSYAGHALAEADFRNRRARHIVYGHTHQHEIVPLDASHADGFVLNQTYFNAGTWRRCYLPTQAIAGRHEFIAADSFTLLAFYQADERSGRSHETWTGTLAPSAIEPQQPRSQVTPAIAAPVVHRAGFSNGRAAIHART